MSLLAATSPLFHYGFDSPLVVLNYMTHVVLYDKRLRLAVWSKGTVYPGTSPKLVPRHDEFHMDHSLHDRDQCDPKAYAEHNKAVGEEDKMDLGHGFGSQFRRQSVLGQHSIDVITNVWPERGGMNRQTKNITEGKIVDLGNNPKTRRLIVTNGPGLEIGKPVEWLKSEKRGCAIPHFSWVHIIRETPTDIQMYAFVYKNTFERPELDILSTDQMSELLGFEVAEDAKSPRAIKAKSKNFGVWW